MKIKVNICGRSLILPTKAADEIMELAFKHGEVIEDKWNRGVDGGEAFYTTHVYEIDPSKFYFNTEMVTDGQYEMFKLAGKP
jgi:hypothetical protein